MRKVRAYLRHAAASPSVTLMAAVVALIAGTAIAAVIFGGEKNRVLPFYWLPFFVFGVTAYFFPGRRTARFAAATVSFFLCGFLKYASASAPVDFVFLPQVKNAFMNAVSSALVEPHASFVNGLLIGEGKLPAELKAAFVATGTVHVMALSGWNLSVIVKYLQKFFLFFPFRKKTRVIFVAVIVVLFTLLTGAPSSLMRAAVMALAMLAASAMGRESQAGRMVILAGGIMLFFSPRLIPSDLGFLLSFSATLGLIYFGKVLLPLFGFITERWRLREMAAETAAATLATMPIMLFAFGRLSLVSLPANLLLLPFVPATMFFGFFSALAAFVFLPLGRFVGLLAAVFAGYDLALIKLLSRLPGAGVNGIKIGFIASLFMATGLVAVAFRLKMKNEDVALS